MTTPTQISDIFINKNLQQDFSGRTSKSSKNEQPFTLPTDRKNQQDPSKNSISNNTDTDQKKPNKIQDNNPNNRPTSDETKTDHHKQEKNSLIAKDQAEENTVVFDQENRISPLLTAPDLNILTITILENEIISDIPTTQDSTNKSTETLSITNTPSNQQHSPYESSLLTDRILSNPSQQAQKASFIQTETTETKQINPLITASTDNIAKPKQDHDNSTIPLNKPQQTVSKFSDLAKNNIDTSPETKEDNSTFLSESTHTKPLKIESEQNLLSKEPLTTLNPASEKIEKPYVSELVQDETPTTKDTTRSIKHEIASYSSEASSHESIVKSETIFSQKNPTTLNKDLETNNLNEENLIRPKELEILTPKQRAHIRQYVQSLSTSNPSLLPAHIQQTNTDAVKESLGIRSGDMLSEINKSYNEKQDQQPSLKTSFLPKPNLFNTEAKLQSSIPHPSEPSTSQENTPSHQAHKTPFSTSTQNALAQSHHIASEQIRESRLKERALDDFKTQLTINRVATNTGSSLNTLQAVTKSSEASHAQTATEVIPAIMEHLDRLQKGEKGNMKIALDLPNGEKLNLSLTMQNSKVSIDIDTDFEEIKDTLSRDWSKLMQKASSQGIQLSQLSFKGIDHKANSKPANSLSTHLSQFA